MRFLLVNNHCISDPTAGVTQSLRTIVRWLAEAGHECHVLTTARFESPRRSGTDFAEDAGRALAESPDISRGMDFLGQMELDAICVCFGTGSMLSGLSFDHAFVSHVSQRTRGTPVTTSTLAMQAAIAATGVRRPHLVTPSWFTDAPDAAAERFFRDAGLAVAALQRFDLGRGWRELPPWWAKRCVSVPTERMRQPTAPFP